MRRGAGLVAIGAFGLGLVLPALPVQGDVPQYVIDISVDGLGSSYLETLIAANRGPNFRRFQLEGTGTLNARSDYDYTVTLPNHVSMMTGRGVAGDEGHGWTSNSDPAAGETLHSNKGAYVASVFDVVHDHGLRTGLYAGKTKFSLLDTSYNAVNGAPDVTGPDDGPDKLDTYMGSGASLTLLRSYLGTMNTNPFNYSLIHFAEADDVGHKNGWGSAGYYNALATIDIYVGHILNLVQTNPVLQGRTTVILTADHGGNGDEHANNADPLDYTIPWYAWGAGVARGANVYALNPASRLDPGEDRPSYAGGQPVRNGDGANLALDLLGLGPVPGSTINGGQDLVVPEPGTVMLLAVGAVVAMRRRRTRAGRGA